MTPFFRMAPLPAKQTGRMKYLVFAHWYSLNALSQRLSALLRKGANPRGRTAHAECVDIICPIGEPECLFRSIDRTGSYSRVAGFPPGIPSIGRSIMRESKSTSSSPFGYSEEEMAQAFQQLLISENGLPGVGCFCAIYREISCRQGRPDFIALRFKSSSGQAQ